MDFLNSQEVHASAIRLVLEKLTRTMSLYVTPEALQSARAARWCADRIGDQFAVALRRDMVGLGGERIRIKERWPESWWEAFKERWFPTFTRWGVLRPVRYRTIDVDRKVYAAVCPHHVPFHRDNQRPEVHVQYLAEMDWARKHGWDPSRE